MSSQYDPIITELFDGKKIVIPERQIDVASLRTAFHRRNVDRKSSWGVFYKEKTLCVQKSKSNDGTIPELVLFLIDKPEKPVYTFRTLD